MIVEPILCSGEDLLKLQSSLITFYTGKTRAATSILSEQSEKAGSNADTQALLSRMTKLAYDLRNELNRGHVEALGSALDEGWRLKREVHPNISNTAIDDYYEMGKRAGAAGGKLLGAGGGGFLMFFAPAERHAEIEKALPLRRIDLALERSGSRVLYITSRGRRNQR